MSHLAPLSPNPPLAPTPGHANLGIASTALAKSGSATSISATTPSPRLVHAAHEFEAAMMKELMAPLSSSKDLIGGSDEEGSNSALTAFAQEALGKALSEKGGFGIARSVLHQLSAKSNHSGKSPVPGAQPTYTQFRHTND